jgi:hypothetical protein
LFDVVRRNILKPYEIEPRLSNGIVKRSEQSCLQVKLIVNDQSSVDIILAEVNSVIFSGIQAKPSIKYKKKLKNCFY